MNSPAHHLIGFFSRPAAFLRSKLLFEAGVIVLLSTLLVWALSFAADARALAAAPHIVW